MQTVVETTAFARSASALLSQQEHDALIAFLAANPYAGEEIAGTGGVRKLRFAAKGKSGGVRIVYYVINEAVPIFALLIYGKGEQDEITPQQRKAVSEIAAAVKAGYKAKRRK